MDIKLFDRLTRTLVASSSRRAVLRSLASAMFGLAPANLPQLTSAKNKNKKRKKPKPNAFGCLDVGEPCRGKDAKCCSGVCQGKKPKKGKKDSSRCVAHDAAGCQDGQNMQACGGAENVPCHTSTDGDGFCRTTTGNGAHCGDSLTCFSCQRDSECAGVCGAGAACIACTGCPFEGGTACAGLSQDSCATV